MMQGYGVTQVLIQVISLVPGHFQGYLLSLVPGPYRGYSDQDRGYHLWGRRASACHTAGGVPLSVSHRRTFLFVIT